MQVHRQAWSILPVIIGATSFTWVVYKLLIKPFLSPLRKIPGRTYKPIIGNMFEALKEEAMTNTINWMKELNSRFIRFYYLYGEERLLTADPAVIKYITVTNSKNYRHSNTAGMIAKLVPDFLLIINGSAHHSLKRLLNPSFNSHSVNGFIPVFDETTKKVVARWSAAIKNNGGQEATVPAQEVMQHITLDAICECGFGYHLHCVEDPASAGVQSLQHILKGFTVRLIQMIPLISRLPSKEKSRQKTDIDFFRSTILTVIKEKREKMEFGGDSSKDLLSALLAAKDEEGNSLPDNIIYSQVGGFLFAGFETTSIGLTWTLLMLAQYPEVQTKARQEVMSLLPDQEQPITAAIVEKLVYLTCVVKESLRLFPPVTVHFRQSINDDVIQGYKIPAGTKIGLASGALHRLPENWDDPDTFKPERFLKEYDPYAFLPFSAGPFMCIGHGFAMTEMKVVLARLLRSFDLAMVPSYKYRRVRQLTMKPHPPLQLRVSFLKN
ncbi:hypothetical protein BaRGS_00034699 [Batillaria attramentaria]|uniref:Cytochrome P450 n=1 Tax=Batillaria attramentaria TaxID=370345 RepID=A0ABD0JH81_9CAEN